YSNDKIGGIISVLYGLRHQSQQLVSVVENMGGL
ncbi:hypothetical protein NPIL_271251, partial [Nephila pilipes]